MTKKYIRNVGLNIIGSVSFELMRNGNISSSNSLFSKLLTSLSTNNKTICCNCTFDSFDLSKI